MIISKEVNIQKDLANKKLLITREFEAPVDKVWRAWTEKDLLEKWWAPKPWRALSKSMDFREGGSWLYYMEGPDGTRYWSRVDYQTIHKEKSFSAVDSFCDEEGRKNPEMPSMRWKNDFEAIGGGTKVTIEILFNSEEDIAKIMEMGFEEGFSSALGNLNELLETK